MPYGGVQGWPNNDPIDLDKESVEGGPVPPAGLYDLKARKLTPRMSSTNKPMLEAQFEVTGAADEAGKACINSLVYSNILLVAGQMRRFKNWVVAWGLTPPATNNFETVTKWCEENIGCEGPAVLRNRPIVRDGVTVKDRLRAEIEYFGEEPPKDDENGTPKARVRGRRPGPRA